MLRQINYRVFCRGRRPRRPEINVEQYRQTMTQRRFVWYLFDANVTLPPLCKGMCHFRKKMTEGLFLPFLFYITKTFSTNVRTILS